MHCRILIRTGLVMVVLFLQGCYAYYHATPASSEKPHDDMIIETLKSESRYYYFTEAQLHRKRGDLDKAIQYLKQAVSRDPESLYLQKELALLYLQHKENSKALNVVEKILEQDPNYVPALIIYGRIKQALKQADDAKQAYERVIAVDPKQQNIYLILGGMYMEEGDLDSALKTYKQLVQNFSESYAGHFFIGKVYAEQGNLAAAEDEFLKTLAMQPDLDEPRFELLKLYKAQKKDRKIFELYNEILQRNPGNVVAGIELGSYYHQQGMTEEAAKVFKDLGTRSLMEKKIVRTIVQLYLEPKKYDTAIVALEGMLKGAPESSELHYVIGVAFDKQENKEKAIAHFQKVKPSSRFYKESVIHIAFLYQELEKIPEAIKVLNDVIQRFPDDTEFMIYLGSFYEEVEQYEKAEHILKKGLEIDPENTKLHFRLGVVYDKWGRKADSIQKMKAVIELDPEHANALNYLGYTYAELGQNLDEAERLIKEALKHKPDDGYITDSLGWVYYKKGLYNKAVKFLEKAVGLEPDDPIILEHLGDAYLKINAKHKALEFYRRSLANKNDDTSDLEKKIQALSEKEE